MDLYDRLQRSQDDARNSARERAERAARGNLAVVALRRAIEVSKDLFPNDDDPEKWLMMSGQPALLMSLRSLLVGVLAYRFPSDESHNTACYSAFEAGGHAMSHEASVAANVCQLATHVVALPVKEDRVQAFANLMTWLRPSSRRKALKELDELEAGVIDEASLEDFSSVLQSVRLPGFEKLHGDRSLLNFWFRWLRGFAFGVPLPWGLQRKVAEIPDGIWQAGLDAVAEEIVKIEALYAVEKALGDLAEERAAARVENRLSIGGNNPPEEIDAVAELQASHTIIWASVEEIAEEVAADVPDKGRVLRALEALKAGLAVCWRYAGRKTDVLVNAGISAGVGYAVANPQKVEALIDAVKGWLPFFD